MKTAQYQILVNGVALKKRFGNRKAAGARFDILRDAASAAQKPVTIELVSTTTKGRLVLRGYKYVGGAK